jgi:glutaminyl-peptide cyclotransferase
MLLAMLALLPGCQHAAPAPPSTPVVANAVTPDPTPTLPTQPTAPAKPAQADHPVFDADRAFTLLREQCKFGPRYLGSPAHQKTLIFLLNEMRKYADDTVTQKFNYRGLPVTNVVGVFYPAGSKKPSEHPVLLMAHWDTRPIADGPYSSEIKKGDFVWGPRGWDRFAPILGANDGASGVAVLLELARLFKQKPPPVGVLLLLDDGEDYGDFRAKNNEGDGVELGSRYFAEHYQSDSRFGHPDYGILLDMIGGKNMKIPMEAFSDQYAPSINQKVFGIANSLGYGDIFLKNATQSVGDDHISINQVGHIATIDLIQPLPGPGAAEYAYMQWHTLEDTPENCSPQSLKAVGDTVAALIYGESPAP